MRILFLCGGSYVFGAEIVELAIMRGLATRGHAVHCVVNGWNDGDFIRRLDAAGIPHTTAFLGKLSLSLHPKYLWWTLDALRHLPGARRVIRRTLRTFAPDVVVVCNRDPLMLLGRLLSGCPVVYHAQELPPHTSRAQRLARWAWRRVTGYVAASAFVAERLMALGATRETVDVAYAGMQGLTVDASRNHDRQAVPVIGICGQIGEWKGHDDLFDALGILRRQDLNFRCHVFGRGDATYVTTLQRRARTHRIDDRIEWRGFAADRAAMYDGLDIVVVPSRFDDPFPTVTLEAALNGLPVVATRRGGLPEQIVDGQTGFLVEAGDPAALAERLERLLTSPTRRQRMGEAARAHVGTRFTDAGMLDAFEAACRHARERYRHRTTNRPSP